jgi:hypothetical protein
LTVSTTPKEDPMAGYDAGKYGRAIMVARVAQGAEWDNPSPTVKALTMLADEIDHGMTRLAEDAVTIGNLFTRFALNMKDGDLHVTPPMRSQQLVDMDRAHAEIAKSRATLARFFRAHFGHRIDVAIGVAGDLPTGDLTKEDLDGPAHDLCALTVDMVKKS